MNILSWNPCGLRNPWGFTTLRDLLKKEVFNLVILQEMKVKTSFFTFKKFIFDYSNCLGVGCEGRSGGLAILWKEDLDFKIPQYSSHHINGVITRKLEEDRPCLKWLLTGVYGHPNVA